MDHITVSELILKGAGQVSSMETTPSRCRGCLSVNDKEGIWSMGVYPGDLRFDGANMDHSVDTTRCRFIATSEGRQYLIEDT